MTMTDPQRHKWVLLTHQIPPKPSGFRVKVWRKLQEIGAIAVKNAVYVLPNTSASLEDFQWLRQEILDAVAEGQFHIFPVVTVDEGIRILTGTEAGEEQADGSYPPGTVNQAVAAKLESFARCLKEHTKEESDPEKRADE